MPFKNKILTYKPEIIAKTDNLISLNKTSEEIKTYLIGEGNNIGVLTVKKYIKWKTVIKPEIIKKTANNLDLEKAPTKSLDIVVLRNKRDTLESLVDLCYSRLGRLSEETKNQIDPRLESHMRSYIEEVRHLIETLAKLSGELSEEQTVVVHIVQAEISKFFKIMHDIIMEVCPEKMLQFKEKMKSKFNSLDGKEAE